MDNNSEIPERSTRPYKYELHINGQIIMGHSPKYLLNIAKRKLDDWEVYAFYKSKIGASQWNKKLSIKNMNEIEKMYHAGVHYKKIASKFNIHPAYVGRLIRKNNWV